VTQQVFTENSAVVGIMPGALGHVTREHQAACVINTAKACGQYNYDEHPIQLRPTPHERSIGSLACAGVGFHSRTCIVLYCIALRYAVASTWVLASVQTCSYTTLCMLEGASARLIGACYRSLAVTAVQTPCWQHPVLGPGGKALLLLR
jgi:hypothetical protein